MSYSGLGTKAGGPIGGKGQTSDYNVDCRWNSDSLIKQIKKTYDLFDQKRVRGGYCSNYDFEDCFCPNSSMLVVYYLDPPYYDKGNELYQEGFTVEDHQRLAKVLRSTDDPWVLSYDDCEEVQALYWWAKTIKISANYTIHTSRNKSELVIVNPRYSNILFDQSQIDLWMY